jgi:hypothetical protein
MALKLLISSCLKDMQATIRAKHVSTLYMVYAENNLGELHG